MMTNALDNVDPFTHHLKASYSHLDIASKGVKFVSKER